jgi:hypothetical protein
MIIVPGLLNLDVKKFSSNSLIIFAVVDFAVWKLPFTTSQGV